MIRRLTTTTAVLTLALSAALLPSLARACGGSIALTASDFDRGAVMTDSAGDTTPQEINDGNAAGRVGVFEDTRAAQRYVRLHLEDQFHQDVTIPWPWAQQNPGVYWSYHYVRYTVATFPTARAALTAYNGDVAYLRTRCRVQKTKTQVGCASGWTAGHPSSTYTGIRLYRNMVLSAEAETRGVGPNFAFQVQRDVHLALMGGYIKIIVLDAECAE